MVCILNRKLLATEAAPQQLGSVKDKLQQAGIPFSITPLRNGSTAMGARGGEEGTCGYDVFSALG